jgi:hypothetical protein
MPLGACAGVTRFCFRTTHNCRMKGQARVSSFVGCLVVLVLAGCGSSQVGLNVFAGSYQGHTRALTITRGGVGKVEDYSGCCDFAFELIFQLSRPRSARGGASATETVTAIRIGDRSVFGRPWHPPHVGETATLNLKDGVIRDSLLGATFWARRRNTGSAARRRSRARLARVRMAR